jgi:hypothetical protein
MDGYEPCDRCGYRAYYFVTIDTDDLPLSFCCHHGNEHEEALMAYATRVVDLRDTLLVESK